MNNVVEPINGRNVINVTLKTSSIVMEAAVVTAMGITKSEKSFPTMFSKWNSSPYLLRVHL